MREADLPTMVGGSGGTVARRVEDLQRRVLRHRWVRSANLGLAAKLRPVLERRSIDATTELVPGSAMFVAPHPDDESIGCGGLIATKRRRGEEVTIVVVTDGSRSHTSDIIDASELRSIRRGELLEAATTLGVPHDHVHLLGMDDRGVADRGDDLVADLRHLLDTLQPTQLIIPSGLDANADHRAVFRAASAAADSSEATPEVLSYLVWFWTPEAWVDQGVSTLVKLRQLLGRVRTFLTSTERLAFDPGPESETKMAAIRSHRSQLENLTGESTWSVIEPSVLDLLVGGRELYLRRDRRAAAPRLSSLNGAAR